MTDRFIHFGDSGGIFGWTNEFGEPAFMSMDAPGLVNDGDVLIAAGGGSTADWTAPGGGSGLGDVVGPGSATDNAIARYDGATGKLIQNAGTLLSDNEDITGLRNLTMSGDLIVDTNTLVVDSANGRVGIGTINSQNILHINSIASPTASQFMVTANELGGLSILTFGGDNANIGFDVEWKSNNWYSTDAGSNALIQKFQDKWRFKYGNGINVGSVVTWNDGIMLDLTNGNVGIGTATSTLLFSTNEKVGLTSLGGLAIKLTNKIGAATVAGTLIGPYSATAIDDAFTIAGVDSDEVIGITYETGVADGSEAWIVISGIADVLIDAGGCARGDRLISSATAGSADVWNVGGAVATHFQEIGHAIETRGGAGLARAVLHFN